MGYGVGLSAMRVALLSALGLNAAAACGGETDVCGSSGPYLLYGAEVPGLERCENGFVHRSSAPVCESPLPRPERVQVHELYEEAFTAYLELPPEERPFECLYDADCTTKEHGYCEADLNYPFPRCRYGCVTDGDCESGQTCVCWQPVGQCAPADCSLDSDCGANGICNVGVEGCGGLSYVGSLHCKRANDECITSNDCDDDEFCEFEEGKGWSCVPAYACGRPFLVQGEARLAVVVEGAGWSGNSRRDAVGLSGMECETLSAHYARLGLMEHASVAAFARFTLELLAHGAPAALVTDAQRALGDEIEHARLCFTLASRYAGHAVGPGPLDVTHALGSVELASTLLTTFLEGCIGETLAALEARVALEQATDDAVRQALARIADDEWQHALLGWRFVQWALPRCAGVGRALREALNAALDAATPALPEPSAALQQHGVVRPGELSKLRRQALGDVVAPCLDALLAERPCSRAEIGLVSES
jgi:hypothetical protein